MFLFIFFFFFKQKTAYEMRISDWSSDVCSSDLRRFVARPVFLNVEPGAKAAPRAAQDHDTYVGAVSEVAEIGVEFADQSLVERIEQIGRASCRERVCQYV